MYLKETISNPIHLTANEKTNFVNVENTLLKIYGQEYFPVKVKSNVRQTNQCHWQDVRLLGLDVIHPYESGSTLFMIYNNDDELVSQFLNLWSLNRDDTILYPDINMILPWKFIAKYILDLNATPKDLYFWTLLNHFSMDELEKSKLTEFCNPSYEEELLEYCRRPKRTIMEILQDFKESIKSFKIEYIFQLIPRIKPREFSIASSAKMGNHLEILASIVSFKTTMKIQRKGACTAFLEKLENNDTVFISLTKTCQFPLYNSVLITKPLILVSTGVGCATFRGIIYDRYVDDRATYIFFGCRRRDLDFYFETFWKKVEQSKNIHIFYAFSRENEKKVYVQNLLLEKSSLLYDIIVKQNGAVFISGKAKQMPTEISNSILQIIKDFGNIKLEKAKQYLSYMEFKNKYQTKTWN
ncbi:hypothetical protein A3Q56_02728 [Intoshia linei]|uniref:FAD-binding FR-type domain-containing protein n=1 Tax=Intoshia linei TaxID=1819745 RepID=A0A177B5C9_9BILA|nr:hypothetical protein A3Q56_02728 [Intoshia linei]